MAEILQRAHVNSGSFYYFLESKEDLLNAVLDWYSENLYLVLVDPASNGVDDPIERIFALLGKYRELILHTQCTCGCPIEQLAIEISTEQREVHAKIAANFDRWAGAVQAGERRVGLKLCGT